MERQNTPLANKSLRWWLELLALISILRYATGTHCNFTIADAHTSHWLPIIYVTSRPQIISWKNVFLNFWIETKSYYFQKAWVDFFWFIQTFGNTPASYTITIEQLELEWSSNKPFQCWRIDKISKLWYPYIYCQKICIILFLLLFPAFHCTIFALNDAGQEARLRQKSSIGKLPRWNIII